MVKRIQFIVKEQDIRLIESASSLQGLAEASFFRMAGLQLAREIVSKNKTKEGGSS